MKNNPVLSLFEWIDDVFSGKSVAQICQWRGAVVPSQRLESQYISDMLRNSHVRTQQEVADDDENEAQGGISAFPEPYTLEMTDGTLVSFMLIRGSRTNMQEMEISEKAERISAKVAGYLNGGAPNSYSFGIYFLHDPFTAGQVFDQKIEPLLSTASRFGGNASAFKADLRRRFVNGAAEEMALFTLRTHMRALRNDEVKAAQQQYRQLIGNIMKSGKGVKNLPNAIHMPYGQALLSKSVAILHKHEGMTSTLLADFNHRTVGLSVTLLSVSEAFERVRRFADREIPQAPNWKARINGQEGAMRTANTNASPAPTPLHLGLQVLSRKVIGDIGAVETAQIGNTWYGSTVVVEGPVSPRQDPVETTFSSLMRKVQSAKIPVCISYEILPNGLQYNRLNQGLNKILGSLGPNNRQISLAYKELYEHQHNYGTVDPVIGLRIALSTWHKEKAKAESALLELNLAVQGWGSAKSSSESGAPDYARISAIPEFAAHSHAPILPAPLQESIYMSPLMRQASPWDQGQLLFKTNEGVIYPVGIGTSKHAAYVTGVCAPSGSGKSFWTNRFHTCLALSPGAMQLPYICNIDVAPSGVGYLRMLRCILPKSMHHLMVYFKVLNDAAYCVNPWDIQLGCTGPTGAERDFITSVLEIVFNGIGEEMSQLISVIIDEAYRMFSPTSTTARLWERGYHEQVTRELDEIGLATGDDKEVTVFQVVDALFRAGRIETARIAQRYAVPRMEDLSRVLSSGRVKQLYGTAKTGVSGELLLEKANRMLQNAVNQYPVLSSVTQIDIDNARVSVIDLQNVVSNSSESGLEFAGMMYLYARHLGARNYFLHEDDIRLVCRPEYMAYQEKRVRGIRQTPKVLTYDEWHNVRRVKGVLSLNEKETRETRKFRVYVNYVTQYITDYPPEILSGMTSVFVVGQASSQQNEHAKLELDLTDTDMNILKQGLDKIGRFWAWFRLREGPVTAVLNNDVGPLETWCYTTDDKDAPLRDELERLIGETEAVTYLAETFPTGSAATYLDRRSIELASDSAKAAAAGTVTAMVARELAHQYHENKRKVA